jgi:hypothetical protein
VFLVFINRTFFIGNSWLKYNRSRIDKRKIVFNVIRLCFDSFFPSLNFWDKILLCCKKAFLITKRSRERRRLCYITNKRQNEKIIFLHQLRKMELYRVLCLFVACLLLCSFIKSDWKSLEKVKRKKRRRWKTKWMNAVLCSERKLKSFFFNEVLRKKISIFIST